MYPDDPMRRKRTVSYGGGGDPATQRRQVRERELTARGENEASLELSDEDWGHVLICCVKEVEERRGIRQRLSEGTAPDFQATAADRCRDRPWGSLDQGIPIAVIYTQK